MRRTLGAAIAVGLTLSAPGRAAEPKVTIGYCTDDLERAKAAGFDYAELGVRNFTALGEDAFRALLERKKAVGLPTPVGYLFLPTDLKVVGPAVDEARETAYVRKAFARAQALGIDTIVFGSGPARTAPDGFPREKAFAQLVSFAKRIAPEARRHGIVLAVEAQRTQETNLVNTTAEAIEWVRAVGDPNFQVMVDFYHLATMQEDPAVLPRAGRMAHVHFANPTGRVFPRDAGEFAYDGFFESLRRTGYPGRISIEARTDDLATDGPKAIAFLRQAASSRPAPPTARADDFVCTEVLGVSVTGDWFGAGFEKGIDEARWQVRWRSKAFVELWADPASDLWALPPQSPCAKRSDDPDRVIFTAVNWEWKTREEWESRLEAAVATIRAKRPGARRIELMTMLRAPGNQTCGSVMTVVQPYVDEAIAAVVARHPGLVTAAPQVFLKTCEPFLNGGPHYTEPGMAAVAEVYRGALAGDGGPERAEILRLEAAWNEAHRRGDADTLEKLWADDLVVTVPNMAVMTKADVLSIVRSGRMKFSRYETSETEVRVSGDTAVATGRLRRTREVGGRVFDDDWRFTKTYRHRGGRWQVAAFEATTR